MPRDSGYLTGQTLLFDVVADMYEEYNVAAENPDVVARLMARLQRFSTSHCAGERCLPDQAGGPKGVPVNDTNAACVVLPWKGVCMPFWKPWRGNPSPEKCDTDRHW
jgi:hypothetical protein